MNTKVKITIGVIAILVVVVGALLYSRNVSATNKLTSLGPNDAMAYRYTAMAQYYSRQAELTNSLASLNRINDISKRTQAQTLLSYLDSGVDLTTLSPQDAMGYRYQAMAYFYITHPDAAR